MEEKKMHLEYKALEYSIPNNDIVEEKTGLWKAGKIEYPAVSEIITSSQTPKWIEV